MPVTFELTLEQLAQVALGAPDMSQVNIAVLHSLINILLKKLNCANEKVSIDGVDSKCIAQILSFSKQTPLAFESSKVELISEHLEKIATLESQVNDLNKKLECHFDEIRQCKDLKEADIFSWKNFEQYSSPCEDFCTACDPDSELACNLVKNADFMMKMMRHISHPMVKRMFEFEAKICALDENFNRFVERVKFAMQKVDMIDLILMELKKFGEMLVKADKKLLAAMEEVQNMLDCKLDKIHLPSLKKYIKDRFEKVEKVVESMKEKSACPRAAGIIMDGIACLSCGAKVCSEVQPLTLAPMPDIKPKTDKVKLVCSGFLKLPTPGVTHHPQVFDSKGIEKFGRTIKDNPCESKDNTYQFTVGTNGVLYRKG